MTVLERIKELGEKRGAAHRAYKAKPSKALHDAWLVATTNLDWAVEDALPHLIAVAEAAQPFLEAQAGILLCWNSNLDASEHVDAISKWKPIYLAALAELTKGAGDER